MKLNRQLILLFIILVSPVFLLNWYANNQTEQILKRHVTNAYMELNKQNHLLINRDIDTVNRVMTTIIVNPVVQQLQAGRQDAMPDADDLYDRVKLYETADKLIPSYSMGTTGGDAIAYYLYVYDPEDLYSFAPHTSPRFRNGGVFFYTDATKPAWADEALALKGRGFLKIIDGVNTGRSQTLAYIRAVNSVYSGKLTVGVLVASNMDKRIEQSLDTVSLPDNGEMYLTDYGNTVLASTVESSMGRQLDLPPSLVNGTKGETTLDDIYKGYIYVQHADYEIKQKLVYRISTASLLQQQSELKRAIQWISIVYSLFAMIVMAYFWRSLLFPLQKLAGFVRGYEPGRKVPNTEAVNRNDEVGVLIHATYSLAQRLNVLIEDRYLMDIKQKEAQLQLLYQQINPHLLYNTLESIYWKSTLEGNSDSAEMIKELSKLMRISLSRGRELITVQEELEHATAYTRLQQKRYEYEFQVRWETDEEAQANLIPKISLQPLIENAIIHGVRNMGEDGVIVVRAFRRDDRVVVEVEDNGYKPVDHEALNRMLREPLPEIRSSGGYGVHNVHERIQLHFGPEYGIQYSSPPGGGTLVTIRLPVRPAHDEPLPSDAD
ncbi:sensor histidine kinase [Cohnella lubricantis]|uniref:Sensor histidine kinase n=2 Tax=Cohnella lubricantis TaxID=2163172 RepID=A0A841TCB9_9BACL|nr:histidine kinase [Cohnella lubricantis]MBB6679113.1 sensor histidine kinase [Cohnella lubricantis]